MRVPGALESPGPWPVAVPVLASMVLAGGGLARSPQAHPARLLAVLQAVLAVIWGVLVLLAPALFRAPADAVLAGTVASLAWLFVLVGLDAALRATPAREPAPANPWLLRSGAVALVVVVAAGALASTLLPEDRARLDLPFRIARAHATLALTMGFLAAAAAVACLLADVAPRTNRFATAVLALLLVQLTVGFVNQGAASVPAIHALHRLLAGLCWTAYVALAWPAFVPRARSAIA